MMIRWKEMYKQKLTVPDEAIKIVQNGDKIAVPIANGQPPALVSAVAKRAKTGELKDSVYFEVLNIRCPQICAPDVAGKIHYECGFVGPLSRGIVNSGVAEFVPIRFSSGKRVLVDDRKFNVVMLTVSPMDKHGYFSSGTNADYSYAIGKAAYPHKILVEVNEKMPRTCGNNQFHITEVDAVVENTLPLTCLPVEPLSKEDEAIGRYIAEQIPDGSCLQLGIGGIPNAVAKFLEHKKDLSVHTEMLCDNYVELYKKGVITSRYKTHMPNKWISTFILGSQETYDFADQNPLVEIWGAEWVNNPQVAALNDNLMTVNATVEVDLTGQCASESMNFKQFSGVGGQADFVQAAAQSRGGKSFLATYSTYTDKEGNLQSKIVPVLNNFVTISRMDVQYVVTEYGIAYLKDKSLKNRVNELTAIAHPDFRDWLKSEAKRFKFTI